MSESTQVITKPKKIKINKVEKNNLTDTLIKNSETYLDDINQYCHNKGILFDTRIELILKILRKEKSDIQEEINSLRKEISNLKRESEKLEFDQDYIEKTAREKLKMVKPGEKVFKIE